MRVFISWSGERSRKIAEFLSSWLKKLPLTINPWVSGEAINPGLRWNKELSEALDGTKFGILCLTNDNQNEPWICFEAGALSKAIEKTHVVPYLIDMMPDKLQQPIKQFQASEATKEGTRKLIETIFQVSEDKTRSLKDINEAFEKWWPNLSEQLEIAKQHINEKDIIKEEVSLEDLKVKLDGILRIIESLSSLMAESMHDNKQSILSLKHAIKRKIDQCIEVPKFYNAYNEYLCKLREFEGREKEIIIEEHEEDEINKK